MKYRNIYMIGIGGIGMSAIARYFHAKGHEVSGYDRTPSEITASLAAEGIAVHFDERPELIPGDPSDTLVIYTPAIPAENRELVFVREKGYRLLKRSRVLGEIAEGKKTMTIQAYSIGGGRIRVSSLDGIDVNFSGESNTLIVRNVDQPGRIGEVSAALSKENVNIATMTVFRDKRGGFAVMVVETDQVVSEEVIHTLESKEGILKVIFLKANGA